MVTWDQSEKIAAHYVNTKRANVQLSILLLVTGTKLKQMIHTNL